jgi:hypothetical protein
MDLSGFAAPIYLCCGGLCIPTIFTSLVYAFIAFNSKTNEDVVRIESKYSVILISVFVIMSIITYALLLYWMKDWYAM